MPLRGPLPAVSSPVPKPSATQAASSNASVASWPMWWVKIFRFGNRGIIAIVYRLDADPIFSLPR